MEIRPLAVTGGNRSGKSEGEAVNAIEDPHKRFYLRTLPGIDDTTEVVAEGTQFSSGEIALHWSGSIVVIAVYRSLHDLLSKHGADHDVLWLDAPTPKRVRDHVATWADKVESVDHGAADCAGVGS